MICFSIPVLSLALSSKPLPNSTWDWENSSGQGSDYAGNILSGVSTIGWNFFLKGVCSANENVLCRYIWVFAYNFDTVLNQFLETLTSDKTNVNRVQLLKFQSLPPFILS